MTIGWLLLGKGTFERPQNRKGKTDEEDPIIHPGKR